MAEPHDGHFSGMWNFLRGHLSSDRKSTRLNSSHTVISYAVFCLKKKKTDTYCHDSLEVSRVLVAQGARWLAVSSVDEVVKRRCGVIRQTRILFMGVFLSYERYAL